MNRHAKILEAIRAFRDDRDWMQFHNPKDLAAALAIEASEIQELFLWKNLEEMEETVATKRERIEEELADVAIYLFELADNLGIDIFDAIEIKLDKNSAKYPIDKAKGRNEKYDAL